MIDGLWLMEVKGRELIVQKMYEVAMACLQFTPIIVVGIKYEIMSF